MKKFLEYMKALGAAVYIGALVIFGIAAFIGELFPAVIPDWMIVAMCIVYAPLWIWMLGSLFKAWSKKQKAKRDKRKKK